MTENCFRTACRPSPRRLRIWLAGLGAAVVLGARVLAAASAQEPAAGNDPPPDDVYVLQVGDELSIKVFERPELDETVRVRPDGKISVVLLDEVRAAGVDTRELDRELTSRYSEFFTDPRVTVIVRSFSSNQVFVGGEVGRPGAMELRGELTVLGAVLQAGGFAGTARTDSVILIRNDGNDRPLVARIDLKRVLNDGAPDTPLRPYDVVYVPMSRIAKVDKFVDEYMRKLIPITLTTGFTYLLGGSSVVIPTR